MKSEKDAIKQSAQGAEPEKKKRHPFSWVLSSYVAMGIPYAMVIWVSGTLFKDLGHSDGEITVAVASIGIVWSLKPFWAGFLEMFKTKKFFVLSMEFVIGILFCLMGLALYLPGYFALIIGLMWIVGIASATQDICCDGIYITALKKKDQAQYIGYQSMAWNTGRIIAQAAVVYFAGILQAKMGMSVKASWMASLVGSGVLMAVFGLYHMVMLPTGSVPVEKKGRTPRQIIGEFLESAGDFCNKRSLWGMLAFVFFFRSSEGLLLVEAPLFMQGCLEDGALQLSLVDKGTIDGLVSTVVSVIGGILGGMFIARYSLKRTLFVLALCVNVPNATYLYLSYAVSPDNPLSFMHISFLVSLEKFFYGFGFVGNMLYMMQQIAPGKFKMTHYAFATALMNLILVPTQMVSGPMADSMGFKPYFLFVMVACIPSLIAAWFAPFPQLKSPNEDVAVDDDSLLDDEDRKVQAASKRANIYTILAVFLFLMLDVLTLGWLSGAKSGGALVFFYGLLGVSTFFKIILAAKGVSAGMSALKSAKGYQGGKAYLSNAKGAMIAGAVMLIVSGILSWYCIDKAKTTDWDCAFSDNAAQCLQPHAGETKQCRVKEVKR
ncbi:MAG: MFS transporter [Deltaproteobacteria bacterium]|nr:MFS transporter [Deltaproteobacteria bacterium]MBN2670819.1 MFS transporter [Deltaproteobacteria bacterium]